MDPLTQGTIGAVLPQAFGGKNLGIVAMLGFFSGMAPDLDIFIRSSTDPLLSLEYHRQFTHSLVFIPFGGLICALFLFVVFKKISPFSKIPVIVDHENKESVFESGAILIYLADKIYSREY